jgi:hypothetical protein
MGNRLQVLIGIAALLVGSLVYLVDRPPNETYFVYSTSIRVSLYNIVPNLFGPIGKSLPAFLHVFSFILITAGLISRWKRGCLIICLCWFLVDCAFELGQKFKELPLKIIPDWFAGIPFLENSENYFLRGIFDVLDLGAIAFGTVAAYLVILISRKRRKCYEKKEQWV